MRTNLLAAFAQGGTFSDMSFETRTQVGIPNIFLENFALDEFKFRWIDALGLETAEWRTSTDLYVALLLATFMSTSGECWPSIESLATPMRKSVDTVRRSLKRLESNGWLIIVSRTNHTNRYQAKLPEYGVLLLLADRESSRKDSLVQARTDVVNQILELVCRKNGFNRGELEKEAGWSRIEGRLYQLLHRLGGPQADNTVLIRWMTDGDWSSVRSPIGFLIDRASKFSIAYSQASGPRPKKVDAADHLFISEVMQKLALANEEMKRSWGANR